jgi:hypothetical protein
MTTTTSIRANRSYSVELATAAGEAEFLADLFGHPGVAVVVTYVRRRIQAARCFAGGSVALAEALTERNVAIAYVAYPGDRLADFYDYDYASLRLAPCGICGAPDDACYCQQDYYDHDYSDEHWDFDADDVA